MELRDLSRTVIDLALLDSSAPKLLSGRLLAQYFTGLTADGHDGASLVSDVEVDLVISRSMLSQQFKLQGHLRAILQYSCALCLTLFQRPMDIALDCYFAVGEDPANHCSEMQMLEDIVFLPDGRLTLLPILEEELILECPIMPRCHDGCAGLCVHCGYNLNTGPCGCCPDEEGHPLSKLRQLSQCIPLKQ
jgi:uncharacterized metal-binding protein YceD (DUF177 family)